MTIVFSNAIVTSNLNHTPASNTDDVYGKSVDDDIDWVSEFVDLQTRRRAERGTEPSVERSYLPLIDERRRQRIVQ